MAGVPLSFPSDEQRRSRARGFFESAAWLFDALSFDDAARGIRRYRDGSGEDIRVDAARHPLVDVAQRSTRARFESQTFTGLSDKLRDGRTLRDLKPGEEAEFDARWDRQYSLRPTAGQEWYKGAAKVAADARDFATNPGTYLTLGRFGVTSRGAFRARRDHNRLRITGNVRHDLGPDGDRFDFNRGQPGGDAASILEPAGEARPFRHRYSRSEPVEALLTYEPDGSLKLGRANWGGGLRW
jgi:hypothetical protein